MGVIKDRDAVIKKLEEAELEMAKTKENHKQERSKLYGQIKEARKLIEDLEVDKGETYELHHAKTCLKALVIVIAK